MISEGACDTEDCCNIRWKLIYNITVLMQDILMNVCNQIVDWPHWFPQYFVYMEVSGVHQFFD